MSMNPKYAIVCVDDDPMIITMLSFQLRKIINQNTTIVETFSEPETVEEHLNELIDFGVEVIFLIVDYQMPKLSGADLVRSIKSKYPELKFVMLSGQANDLVVRQLLDDKLLDAFLPKPWDEDKLFSVIEPILPKVEG